MSIYRYRTQAEADRAYRHFRMRDAWEVCTPCGKTFYPRTTLTTVYCLQCTEEKEAQEE